LDRSPEQKLSAPKVIEADIRAPVLVDKSVPVTERKDRGHGLLIFKGDSDLERFAKAIDQISVPELRLWRNPVPPPRSEEQIPESVEKRFTPAGFAN